MGQQSVEVEEVSSVSDAVHKLQLYLLDGVKDENQLFAAGSLMSRSDYEDTVTERSIAKLCGYPLCHKSLPAGQLKKGRYRIALKEHKVYDLHETSVYCSTACAVNSRAFAESLQNKRCAVLDSAKLNEIMRLFENVGLNSDEDLGKDGDLGLHELKIQEKTDVKGGEVTFVNWVGPSNAIEGYVPDMDLSLKQAKDKGARIKKSVPKKENSSVFSDLDFTSVILTQDEYNSSKEPLASVCDDGGNHFLVLKDLRSATKNEPCIASKDTQSSSSEGGKFVSVDVSSCHLHSVPTTSSVDSVDEATMAKVVESSKTSISSARNKSSGGKKATRTVTWADEKIDGGNLCEVEEHDNTKEASNDEDLERLALAKACAAALNQAAEAVASGVFDTDALSEAGILLLPQLPDSDGGECRNGDRADSTAEKWPSKSGEDEIDTVESGDSWFDTPPEGFSLTLSPFATMWNALFTWITSSSLAYIYGKDGSEHLEYLFVNGAEYSQQIVVAGGRSFEIKQALTGCLGRAFDDVFPLLKVPTPPYTLHHGLGKLLDTMTFVDALPPFRMKQWKVIVLLFIDALTVCRLPGLKPFWDSRRMLIPKLLEGSKITPEDYKFMIDLILPLGGEPPSP